MQAVGAYAGYAWNDETNFLCYKDNGRTLYSEYSILRDIPAKSTVETLTKHAATTGLSYKSIYYCFDA